MNAIARQLGGKEYVRWAILIVAAFYITFVLFYVSPIMTVPVPGKLELSSIMSVIVVLSFILGVLPLFNGQKFVTPTSLTVLQYPFSQAVMVVGYATVISVFYPHVAVWAMIGMVGAMALASTLLLVPDSSKISNGFSIIGMVGILLILVNMLLENPPWNLDTILLNALVICALVVSGKSSAASNCTRVDYPLAGAVCSIHIAFLSFIV